ncbi:hypothetical protein ABBQ32_009757 [Trebouxia sp. C0010 RCD-2024]
MGQSGMLLCAEDHLRKHVLLRCFLRVAMKVTGRSPLAPQVFIRLNSVTLLAASMWNGIEKHSIPDEGVMCAACLWLYELRAHCMLCPVQTVLSLHLAAQPLSCLVLWHVLLGPDCVLWLVCNKQDLPTQ